MSYTINSTVQLTDTLDVDGTTTLADRVIFNTDGTIKPVNANQYINIQRHASSSQYSYDGQIGKVYIQHHYIKGDDAGPLWGGVAIKSIRLGTAGYDSSGTMTTVPPFYLRANSVGSDTTCFAVELSGGLMNIVPNSSTNGAGLIMTAGNPSISDLIGKLTVNTRKLQYSVSAVGYTIYDQFYPANSSGNVAGYYSIYALGLVGASGYVSTSDERIKTDITVVDDDWALQKVRDIECKDYHYVDPALKSEHKTIGFIAQDVEQHLPHAVTTITSFIPDELRSIFFAGITNLPDGNVKVKLPPINWLPEHTRKIKAYVRMEGEEEETEIVETVDDDNCIVIEKAYTHFYLHSKQVNNFKQLDKNKIFALHHSAIQQLDRNQQEDDQAIVALQEENALLKTQMADVLARLQAAGL